MPPQTLTFDQYMAGQTPPPSALTFDSFMARQNSEAPPSTASRIRDNFLSGLVITDDEGAKNFFEHPIDTLMGSFEGQGALYEKAKDAYKRGDYKNAVIHGLNYLVPFIGQQTDKAGQQLEEGDIAGGVSRTLGAALPIVAGSPEARAAASDAASAAVSRIKPALATTGKAATAIGESLDPDLVGLVSPRAAHALRMARKVGKVATKLGTEAAPEAESVAPAAAASTPTAPAAPPATTPAAVAKQLNEALGGKPLDPNIPLRQQLPAAKPSALPEGFTPVKSSVLKGYRYDPATQELEAITNSGSRYRTGEVSPDQFKEFEAADSKGAAWNKLRGNATPLGKYVGDKFVPYQRAGLRSASPETPAAEPPAAAPAKAKTLADLNTALKDSLRKVDGDTQSLNTGPVPSNGHTWEYKNGNFLKDGKVLDKSDDIADATAALSQKDYFAGKTIEGQVASPKLSSLKGAAAGDDLLTQLKKSLENVNAKKKLSDLKNPAVETSYSPAQLAKRWGVDEDSLASGREQTRGMSAEETEDYIQKLVDRYKEGKEVDPVIEYRDADNNLVSVDGRARAIAAKRAGIKRIPLRIVRETTPVKQ